MFELYVALTGVGLAICHYYLRHPSVKAYGAMIFVSVIQTVVAGILWWDAGWLVAVGAVAAGGILSIGYVVSLFDSVAEYARQHADAAYKMIWTSR